MSEIEITDKNFEAEILNSSIPALVDFWASWCGPCKMIAPVIEEIAAEYSSRLKVGKVNTDENPNLCARFTIISIPTLMIFKDKKAVQTLVGFRSKAELKKTIDAIIGK